MTDIFDEEKTHQETESTKTESQCPGGQTKQKRSQLLGELYRVRKEMINNSTIVSKPEVLKCMYTGCERNFLQGRDNATRVEGIDGSIACNLCITVSDLGARSRKPYTPDVFNDLSPYYNKFIIDYMINDQIDYVPRPGWGTRATSLRLVDPDVSWRMDHFPGPVYDSVVPRGFYKPQIWSKNVPGKDDAQGSTRLPPIPKVTYPRFQQKQYQHFNMDYSHVQPFRRDIERLKETKAQRRMKEDQTRTLNDWNRMNLAELKTLPLQSRFHVKKAITSYLGTSKGCNKALRPLLDELNTYERLVQPEKA